jgi:regulatory protein
MDGPDPKYSEKDALARMRRYCALQERCQQEVRNKLYEYGFWKNEVEGIISQLIGENFLDELRFAELYAGGKFRMKRWGKKKIVMHLKQKQISDYSIKHAFKVIEDEDYKKALHELIEKKVRLSNESDPFKRRSKMGKYLINKGYESEMVWKALKELNV